MERTRRTGQAALAWLLLFLVILAGPGCGRKAAEPPARSPKRTSYRPPTGRTAQDGPEADLPWDDDPEFLAARRDHGTPVLVASFRASLPDPILHERDNIALGATYLKGAVVAPDEVFSLNARLGQRTAARGFRPGPLYEGDRLATSIGGGVCKIATVLYNAVVLADLAVVERHTHSMTVPYVPPGQDATIVWGGKDLRFRNTTGAPLLIWARNTGPTLYVGLYGKSKPAKITWEHQVLQRTGYKTVEQRDKSLRSGQRRVLQPGAEGVVVHSWLITAYPDGRKSRRDLGISQYRPEPRIIATGG